MSKRKKGSQMPDNSGTELEYACPSASEMTGLIPRGMDDSEIDSYDDIYPFTPLDKRDMTR